MSTTPKVDDGGPAFPAPQNGPDGCTQYGMSLRDWFAGQEKLADCNDIAISSMESIIGEESPRFSDNPLAYFIWEAKALAALRYIRADAMLRARQLPPT